MHRAYSFVDTLYVLQLKEKVKPGISHYEVSDRHAILYIDEIPSDHELCYNLELTRDFAVGIVQPVPVTVYDYYEPGQGKLRPCPHVCGYF